MSLAAMGPVKFAAVSMSTEAANEVVAAVTGKCIRVLALVITGSAAVTIKIQDDATTPKDISGVMDVGAADNIVLPYNPVGWGHTGVGQALDFLQAGAGTVSGMIVYQEIDDPGV